MVRDISLEGTKKLKERLKPFNLNTWCVCELYLRHIGKYLSDGFVKIIVQANVDDTQNNVVEDMLNVVLIHKTFDFEEYFQLEEKYEKKKVLLDVLQDGLITLALKKGWNTDALLDAYNSCLKDDLECKWFAKNKYFQSPDRKHYAAVFCEYDIDKFEVSVVFYNKKKEKIHRVTLYSIEPNMAEPLGKMGWDKLNGEFYLLSKNGRQKWVAGLPLQ
jgi:hypothetical protein